MAKFEIGKNYFIDNRDCKIIFKVSDRRASCLSCGVLLELVKLETKYIGTMPVDLFQFLKRWFDFGNYNYLNTYKSAEGCELINFDNDNKYISRWNLWACDEAE